MAVNTITGTTGNDLLQGQQLSGDQNLINGLAGNDTLIAATVSDTLNGGAGNDSLTYGTGLTINGAAAFGGSGSDSFFVNGTTLLAGTYSGESGNDLFNFTAATNVSSTSVRGGEGSDTVTFAAGGATLNGFVATMGQGGDLINFTGSSFVAGAVYGGEGNDTLQFANSLNNTTIGGNEGADRIQIGTATLVNTFIGAGKGHDIITTTALGGGITTTLASIVGGEGFDTITLSLSAVSTLAVFGDVTEGGDSTLGQSDFLSFSAQTAGIQGSIFGGAGNDTIAVTGVLVDSRTAVALNIFGNLGNDSININAGGNTTIAGGAGNDTLVGNFSFAAATANAGIASAFKIDGGTGVDRLLLNNIAAVGLTGFTAAGTANAVGNFILGNFADSGDNLILQSFGGNTSNYSGTNFIATGAQAIAAQVVTGGTFTGAFVYNITGGFTSVAASGFRVGDLNIFEANGDTVIQMLGTNAEGQTGTVMIGGLIGTAQTGQNFYALTFNLSANLGVIDNGTAGFISKTGVNLNFGISSDSTLGRNGFTITVV